MPRYRPATIDDLEILRHWDKQEHIKAATQDADWNWPVELKRSPPWREQWIVEVEVKPIGFIQIIDPAEEETRFWGKVGEGKKAIDIWIGEKEFLGKGYGTRMMHWTLDRCFEDSKVNEVLIDPLETNVKAIAFYRRIGFEFKEHRMLGGVWSPVYAIRRKESKSKNEITTDAKN